MKLLFDQNLSFKLCLPLNTSFGESQHARLLGLDRADDNTVWRYAGEHGFMLVTPDADFAEMSVLRGSPPKVIWLHCGNQPSSIVEKLLLRHIEAIRAFERDPAACLEIY